MNFTRNYLNIDYIEGASLLLEGNSAHHLIKVLRKKVGDQLELFNGKGGSAISIIKDIKKSSVEIEVITKKQAILRKGINISLGQALIKPDPFNFSVQKATELGVISITPLQTERSVVKIDKLSLEKKLSKWKTIMQGACEQCGENWLPTINYPMPISEWASKEESNQKIVLYPGAEKKISDIQYEDSVSVAIGPEGDFSLSEIEELIDFGYTPVTIGKRILRAETAVISSLSAIRTLAREF